MISFFKSQKGYSPVEDEEELKLGGDSMSRSNRMTFKIGRYSVVVLAVLLISSIASTWVLFFDARRSAQHDPAFFVFNGLNPTSSIEPSWVCQRPTTRREWRTLSEPEKVNYVTAVKCLATKPSKLRNTGTLYDDFAWVHKYLSSGSKSYGISLGIVTLAC